MKILDKYLLKSFLSTFLSVFVILFFIFVLQVVWLFIAELAGKDLDVMLILKFLLFKMPSVVPLVLPLSILLASIMTFGSFAENYEFAAMKSAGISLQRAMRSLSVFILFFSFLAFLFANNVIPYADYKFTNFRRNLAQVKPAMAIVEKQFSKVGNYNIKVEKKLGENGRLLEQVTIHKSNPTEGSNGIVIKAKKGELISNENSNVLKLVLKNGNYYEDIIPQKYEDRIKLPFAKSEFKKYVINIDLSKLNPENANTPLIRNDAMLTVGELRYTLDSLQKNYNKDIISFTDNVSQRPFLNFTDANINFKTTDLSKFTVLDNFNTNDKNQILKIAMSNVDATHFSLENIKFELAEKQKNMNAHWISFYDKFVIAFSCILMFFIGAPLGAIIRKGGLGMPIVFAVLIFIAFHFINTFGKKVAEENGITPFLGCWMSTLILAPFAIILTVKATDDRGFTFNIDWFIPLMNKLFSKKNKTIENTVSNSIKMEEKLEPILEPINVESISSFYKRYTIFSRLALVSNLLLIVIYYFESIGENVKVLLEIILIVSLVINFLKANQFSIKMDKELKIKNDLKWITSLLASVPFYFIFYIFNFMHYKKLISNSKKSI